VLVLIFALFFNLDFTSALPGLVLVLALGTLGLAAVVLLVYWRRLAGRAKALASRRSRGDT
jgi:ABC-type transport system involved in cytochrome c biogenesis permease component